MSCSKCSKAVMVNVLPPALPAPPLLPLFPCSPSFIRLFSSSFPITLLIPPCTCPFSLYLPHSFFSSPLALQRLCSCKALTPSSPLPFHPLSLTSALPPLLPHNTFLYSLLVISHLPFYSYCTRLSSRISLHKAWHVT